MRLLVKIGGAQLDQPEPRAQFATAVQRAVAAGHEVVVVHGGGRPLSTWSKALGVEPRFDEGLRITDAATAEVATAVLRGLVNAQLVSALQRAGVPAAGICGADGGAFAAARFAPVGRDLGFVGAVATTDTTLPELLLGHGMVCVIATIAPLTAGAEGDRAALYNINADDAAAALAIALSADAALFLCDVPGVLDPRGDKIAHLDCALRDQLCAAGALAGGMQPKTRAALATAGALPDCHVVIAAAASSDAVLDALTPGAGTRICRTLSTDIPPTAAETSR